MQLFQTHNKNMAYKYLFTIKLSKICHYIYIENIAKQTISSYHQTISDLTNALLTFVLENGSFLSCPWCPNNTTL